jgi:hypothetical protein
MLLKNSLLQGGKGSEKNPLKGSLPFENRHAAWRIGRLDRGICEYHNYSMLGGLALTNLPYLFEDVRELTRSNSALYCYMHVLETNAGPRRVLDLGIARATWASSEPESQDQFLREYFASRYGPVAESWLGVHKTIAESLANVREMFLFASLESMLLDHRSARPTYRPKEVIDWIRLYERGGRQRLPARLDLAWWQTANFIGLERSLMLQAEAERRWDSIRMSAATEWQPALDQDIAWFRSTSDRYRLLARAAALYRAEHARAGPRIEEIRRLGAEMLVLCDSLDGPLLRSTVSGIDQSAFLARYREWARAALASTS